MMLIFNQDKTVVANLSETRTIEMFTREDGLNIVTANNFLWLGQYADKETAKAALAQLVEAYQAGWRVFNMPSEDKEANNERA